MAATAFSVILLEVYSGVLPGPWWWVIPGGLVLSVVLSVAMLGERILAKPAEGGSQGVSPGLWAAIIFFSFGMSFLSNYFGRVVIMDIAEKRVAAAVEAATGQP